MTWLVLLSNPSFAWPADADWVALRQNGDPLVDVAGDHVVGDPSLDLVGQLSMPAQPTALWYADADALYVRLRVDGDPLTMTGAFRAQDWGVLVELDGDDTFEYALIAESAAADLRAYPNVDAVPGTQPGFTAYGQPWLLGDLAGGQVRRELGGADTYFVDLQVSRDQLVDLGVADTAEIRFTVVTGPSIYLPWSDLAACDGAPLDCPDLGPVQTDPVSVDRDQDGLTDPIEAAAGTDPLDADSDDDGLIDGEEGVLDSDGDGALDALDCDSDGDGVFDSVESGVTVADVLAATDVNASCFVADADPTGPDSDPTLADTDAGGLDDGVEDWNTDGALDVWETDPTDPSDDQDTDGDLIADVLEALGEDGSVDDLDSDGDGLPDADEWLFDHDGDGVPNFLDDDSDGDGLLDVDEGLDDVDGDGLGNYADPDSDGDGIPDSVEGLVDSDGDGTPDAQDLDSDDDDVRDELEGDDDFDGDGVPDYLDDDSDGDGLSDEVEGDDDVDDDGFINTNDLDSDGDGIPDDVEGDDDVDNDGLGNFEDRNSDGQGPNDANEGFGDGDCDGIEDWLDPDEEDSFCDPTQEDPGIGDAPETPDDPEVVDFTSGNFTGGSCSTAGSAGLAGWLAMPLAMLAVLARRRRRSIAAGLVATGALASGTAAAQDLNAQRFDPTLDGQDFLQLDTLQLDEAGTARFGAWLNVADDPFVFRPDGADEVDVLGTLATTNVTAAYSFGPARIGVDLPVHLYAVGSGFDHPTHLGDLRLSAKGRGLQRTIGASTLSLGMVAEAILPTGNPEAWVGSGRAWVRGNVVGDLAWKDWRFAASLGARSGTGQDIGGLDVAPGMLWGAGAAYRVLPSFVAALELDGDVWFGNGGQPGAIPLEWLASAQVHPDGPQGPWTVRAGVGTGLTQGAGSPDVRVVGGVGFTPGRGIRAMQTADSGARPAEVPVETAISEVGSLVVRVDNPYGTPVEGASIRLIPEGADAQREQVRTDEAGTLDAELPVGNWTVDVSAAGYTPETRRVVVTPDGTADVSLLLHPDQVVVDPVAKRVFLNRKVFFELDRAELKVESLAVLDDLTEAWSTIRRSRGCASRATPTRRARTPTTRSSRRPVQMRCCATSPATASHPSGWSRRASARPGCSSRATARTCTRRTDAWSCTSSLWPLTRQRAGLPEPLQRPAGSPYVRPRALWLSDVSGPNHPALLGESDLGRQTLDPGVGVVGMAGQEQSHAAGLELHDRLDGAIAPLGNGCEGRIHRTERGELPERPPGGGRHREVVQRRVFDAPGRADPAAVDGLDLVVPARSVRAVCPSDEEPGVVALGLGFGGDPPRPGVDAVEIDRGVVGLEEVGQGHLAVVQGLPLILGKRPAAEPQPRFLEGLPNARHQEAHSVGLGEARHSGGHVGQRRGSARQAGVVGEGVARVDPASRKHPGVGEEPRTAVALEHEHLHAARGVGRAKQEDGGGAPGGGRSCRRSVAGHGGPVNASSCAICCSSSSSSACAPPA